MRLCYFGYYLEHNITCERRLVDLTDFLTSFAEFEDPDFKRNFIYNQEHIYLHKLRGSVCLLVMTRDSDQFKRINTTNLDIGEIHKILGQDEKIGFASYLVIRPHFFGFASSSLSPKFDSFCSMVNQLLHYTNNGSWRFCIKPLIQQATKDEAVSMQFIGKTTIEVDRGNSLFRQFFSFLGCDETADLEALEITLKPRKNHNIKNIVKQVVNCADDEGIQKLTMKARDEINSTLIDLYVVGRGALSDSLGNYEESVIPSIIETKIRENTKLTEQLAEFTDGFDKKTDTPDSIHLCLDVDTWSSVAMDLQGDFKLRP